MKCKRGILTSCVREDDSILKDYKISKVVCDQCETDYEKYENSLPDDCDVQLQNAYF